MRRDPTEEQAEPLLKLAREFENAAEIYREMRLHGPANDADAWKGVCTDLAADAAAKLARVA